MPGATTTDLRALRVWGVLSLVTNTRPGKLSTLMWEVSRGRLQEVGFTSAVGK
jgi:hypothetical protein